jgi:hypothetical protein
MIDPTLAKSLTETSNVAKFPNVGDKVVIKITDLQEREQTDFRTGEVLTWKDGSPKKQFVFYGVDQDTGEETRIFAKGFMLGAIKDALREANANVEEGGVLAVQFSHEEQTEPGLNPAKKYKAQYKPPVKSISADDLI